MKIVAIALASAALVTLAQPGFAQQRMDQYRADRMDRPQSGAMHNQFQNDDEQSATSGQGNNWSERDNWRDRDDRDGGRMHRGSMQGDMEGRMGGRVDQMMRMHERMHNANEGAARFRFRRGQAAIDVQCPKAESLQACINAAGQLLDKIGNLRERNAQGTTSGSGLGSENGDTLSSQPGSLSNQQMNRPGGSRGDSEQ